MQVDTKVQRGSSWLELKWRQLGSFLLCCFTGSLGQCFYCNAVGCLQGRLWIHAASRPLNALNQLKTRENHFSISKHQLYYRSASSLKRGDNTREFKWFFQLIIKNKSAHLVIWTWIRSLRFLQHATIFENIPRLWFLELQLNELFGCGIRS